MPETSIIIRTFNEAKHLNTLFDAIERQSYRDFETIVIDSGSFDGTRQIADARADQVLRIAKHDFTFGFSLNAGIRAAKGEIAAIVSAHTIPGDKNWLEDLTAPLRTTDDVAMTYGRQYGGPASKFGEAEDFERLFGTKPRTETQSRFRVNNANSAIRRDLWMQYPFDEALTGLEDIDWARHWMNEGWHVFYIPTAGILHIHEESWRQVRNRFYREAVAWRRMNLMGRRHVPGEVVKEVSRTVVDMARAITGGDNPVSARLRWDQRMREIIYYRSNKLAGTMRGLIESHPLETRESQEKLMFEASADAVVISAPGKASLQTIDLPEPKPGEALIQVAYTAICATDHEIFDGSLGYYKNGMASYPITPGHEFSGIVVGVGPNVRAVKKGDKVVAECIQSCGQCGECLDGNTIGCPDRSELGVLGRDGAYASYVTVPAQFLHKLPVDMPLQNAALVEPTAVCLKALRRLRPILNARVNGANSPKCAIIGAGPLGHLFAKILSHEGIEVTAFDRNPKRLALLEDSGLKAGKNLSELSKFSFIVEITGDPDVLSAAFHACPANSTLLLLGLPYGEKPFSFETIAAYDKTVVGSVGSTAEDFEEAVKLLPKLDVDPFLHSVYPLKDFRDAWSKSLSGDALKVMLSPNTAIHSVDAAKS